MDHIYVPTFLFIVRVFCTFFTGGAAERAGLHSGDKIIKVFTPYFVLPFLLLVAVGLVLFM